jgi:Polyketide cyclase / dehydrase and lipid transport
MEVDVTTTAVIRRPRPAVATYAADPANAPAWYANIRSVHWRTAPPLAVGSQVDFVAAFLGRRLSYTYEVAELVAGERLVMRTSDGPFPMETTYAWADVDDGSTRMTLRNRGRPSGLFRALTPLVATAVRRANRKDLARLAELLEDRPRPVMPR